jgi:hypothetical protein
MKPWERYATTSTQQKPWEKYAATQATQPREDSINPTADMSTTEKLAAGAGSAVTDAGLGVKQALTEYGNQQTIGQQLSPQQQMTMLYWGQDLNRKLIPDSAVADVQKEVDDKRRLDAPLMDTGAGKTGAVLGNIGMTVPALAIPGANTYTGSALMGGLMGMAQPTSEGESRGLNTTKGGAFGVAGKFGGDALARSLRASYQGAKALLAPFFDSGREGITANTLKAFASNPDEVAARLAQAKELIPGSTPTAADVAQDAGISQLQRSIQASDAQISDNFAQRALDRNSARLDAMKGLTKYGDDLDGAIERRGDAGSKLYEKAFSQTVKNDARLKEIAGRPAFQEAMRRAKNIAANEGKKVTVAKKTGALSVEGLHYIKMGFDDLINDAPNSGIGNIELNAIKKQRGEFVEWMAEKNPAYNTARVRFEKMSRPINRQQIADTLLNKATRSQTPNIRGEMTIYPSSFGTALKNEGENVVKQATGRVGKSLDDVMTPDQMQTIQNVLKDSSQEQAGINFGRAVGSNTAQNLAGMNLLRQTSGPLGFPGIQGWAERNVFPSISRGMNLLYGGQEPLIKQKIAEALLNPKKAAELMKTLPPPQRSMLVKELLNASKMLPASTATAISTQD